MEPGSLSSKATLKRSKNLSEMIILKSPSDEKVLAETSTTNFKTLKQGMGC